MEKKVYLIRADDLERREKMLAEAQIPESETDWGTWIRMGDYMLAE